jgi:hypothetical protein
VRPDAEKEPNRLGATLANIRNAIESVTRDRMASGDPTLSLVAGKSTISEEHLGDGIHPGDEGHKRIASAVAKALTTAMKSARDLPPPVEVDDTWDFVDRDDSDTGGHADGGDDADGADDGDIGPDDDAMADDVEDSEVAAAASAG